MQRFQQAGGDFGWKPHKLDVEAVQKVAYEAYHNKGYACGYGVFWRSWKRFSCSSFEICSQNFMRIAPQS